MKQFLLKAYNFQVDYDLVKENGGECKLWPTPRVSLDNIDPMFRHHIANLKWYSCLPQTKYFFFQ